MLQETEPNLKFRSSERFGWFTFELDAPSHVELNVIVVKHEEGDADRMILRQPSQERQNVNMQSHEYLQQQDDEIPQEPETKFNHVGDEG